MRETEAGRIPVLLHRATISFVIGAVAIMATPIQAQDCNRGPQISMLSHGFESHDSGPSRALPSQPYNHVTPADVGVEIGVGVVGAVPDQPYTGPNEITTPGLIENVVIDGCLRIDSDDVTIRNTIISCGGLYPIKVEGGSRNFIVEYSRLVCSSSSKIFYFESGAPNARVAYNEASGCQDFFYIQGDLDGVTVLGNYMHTLIGSSGAHADGFQIGQASTATGTVHIRGNYFDPDNEEIGKTDLVFATNSSEVHLVIEDNFINRWGHYTMRCGGQTTACTIRNNVYSQAFEGVEQRLLLVNANAPSMPAAYCCNRYADGSLVEEYFGNTDLVLGAEHQVENCPPF